MGIGLDSSCPLHQEELWQLSMGDSLPPGALQTKFKFQICYRKGELDFGKLGMGKGLKDHHETGGLESSLCFQTQQPPDAEARR